ncbi:Clavaminate synthase-like protein [Amylocystis lapponica]|nr:Clavaminate synthase-like protein [Amylocystis lapponica]
MHAPDVLQWIAAEYHGAPQPLALRRPPPPPSTVHFSRLVRIARPVLFTHDSGMTHALSRWSNDYLSQCMAHRSISVAVTPNGRADAITPGPDGRRYFVEPHVEKMTMAAFLDKLSPEANASASEVYYLQSQNGNMYTNRYFDPTAEDDPSEFEPLRNDVPSDISWCTDALDKSPDAVNLWIGDSSSVTSIHSDPYENIYTVVRGAKHFTLLPPTEGWCLQERTYPHATYTRSPTTAQLALVPSPPSTPAVRWSSIMDPTAPGALPPDAHPIHITVRAGETLYLPAGWWHYVRQTGLTIAVNYWYDMETRGMSWVWLNFLRGLREPPDGNESEQAPDARVLGES